MRDFRASVEFVGKVNAQKALLTEEISAKNSHQSAKISFFRILAKPKFFDMFYCNISF